jgi:hypothetical protein
MMFVYAIRSPYTKEYYFRRLRIFFDAINLAKGSTTTGFNVLEVTMLIIMGNQ